MNKKSEKTIKSKLQRIAIERYLIEGLARVLIECIRNGENLKNCDTETVALVLYERIKSAKGEIEFLHKYLEI